MSDLVLECHGAVDAAAFEHLRTHSTMERALAWFFAQDPPLTPETLIPQDEFSYDLLVPLRDGRYLVYDTS